MIDHTHSLEKENKQSSSASCITSETGTVSDTYKTNESLTSLSSLSMSKEIKSHTKIYLKYKQVRCIWCSRVNLVEKKTTMMCQECENFLSRLLRIKLLVSSCSIRWSSSYTSKRY